MTPDETFLEICHAHFDGRLDEADRKELEARLAASADCRKVFDSLAALASRLEDLPMPKPPADLQARILDRIRTEVGATPKPVPLFPRLAKFAAAAVLVVGVSSLLVFHAPTQNFTRLQTADAQLEDAMQDIWLSAQEAPTDSVPETFIE